MPVIHHSHECCAEVFNLLQKGKEEDWRDGRSSSRCLLVVGKCLWLELLHGLVFGHGRCVANLVFADNCDVSTDDVCQPFTFDFAAQFEFRLLDPVLAYCIPTLFDATH